MTANQHFFKSTLSNLVDKISHLPIQELHTDDLKCELIKIVTNFPNLKMLYIDSIYGFDIERKSNILHLEYCLEIPLVIHTSSLDWSTGVTCEGFLAICDTLTVKEVHLNRQVYESQPFWTFENVQLLTNIPLILHTNVFDWESETFESFLKFSETLTNIKGLHLDHQCNNYESRLGIHEIKLLKKKCPIRGLSSECICDMDRNLGEYLNLFECNQI